MSTQTANEQRVIAVDFDTFLLWVRETWMAGQHWALIGPTGEGKTTFAVGILNQRNWVIALDPKGEDETLEASGFIRVTRFPLPRDLQEMVAEEQPVRIIIGGSARSERERRQLRELMRQYVEMVRQQGGWTLYADEFQVLADLRMFRLGVQVEELLITARKEKTSVVTAFQAPAWVPRASTRQATRTTMWPTRDVAMIKTVAESMGRDRRELTQVIHELPSFHPVTIVKRIAAPYVITSPPRIN